MEGKFGTVGAVASAFVCGFRSPDEVPNVNILSSLYIIN